MSRPKMCPSCGKLMGVARECPYCGADAGALGTKLKALGRAATKSGEHGSPATFVIIFACVAIYGASIAFGGVGEGGGMLVMSPTSSTQIRMGSLVPVMVDAGQWWRLVTANFLHWGALHLLMNVMGIWVTGRPYEEEVGWAPLVGLFLLSGIGGMAFSYAVGSSERHIVGASAGAFGLIGALIGWRRYHDGNFRDRRTLYAIQIAVLMMVFGLATRADNYAHFGGLVVGAVFAYLHARFIRARAGWTALGVGLTALTAASFAFAVATPYADLEAVQRSIACRNMSVEAVGDDERAVDVDKIERAKSCLARVGTLTPDADVLLDAVKKGLDRADKGRRTGAFSEERAGAVAVYEAVHAFDRWLGAYMRLLGVQVPDD